MPAPEPDELQGADHVAHLVMQERARPRFDVDFLTLALRLERDRDS